MICQKCSKEFPMYVVIDGKKRCLSSRKFCLDCSPFNYASKKQNDYLICPDCNRQLTQDDFYFKKHKDGVKHWKMCKQCYNQKSKVVRDNNRKMYIEYAGGKCVKCGYNKCLAALEFHHLDPIQKDFTIASITHHTSQKTIDKVKHEINKCILVCANCHRETHHLK